MTNKLKDLLAWVTMHIMALFSKDLRMVLSRMKRETMNPVELVINDDEDCPCGSGKTYQNCCKERPDTGPVQSRKPVDVLVMEQIRKSMIKCCLHPDQAGCKGPIKEAHALQNHKIISLIAGSDHHVWMMDKARQPVVRQMPDGEIISYMEFSRTGANDATTETCFCDRHDNISFAAIEKGAPNFDDASEEMKFTYAYKAFIFEYYKQYVMLKIFRENFMKRPPVFSLPENVAQYRMLQMRSKEFESIKAHFDTQIMSCAHEGVTTCIVKIPEQIRFANYTYIAPDYDLDGKVINHTLDGVMHRIAVTVFPETTVSYILLSCLTSEKSIYDALFGQVSTYPIERVKYYFNLILPLYSENLVLSKSLWDSLKKPGQFGLTHMANLIGPDMAKMNVLIGMGLRNAAKDRHSNYLNRGKVDLFL